ncbi:hypothetical protein PanWU01x14_052540 [Parasponia andersonii]|uniref:Secreted protein n=1 Tax=Parasponia andersonii TaxID=3476 RepID=A0A2P5DM98_PARAD|nr:hypothetical protein PanWU01x14_052540 [Parasponia andersonii]
MPRKGMGNTWLASSELGWVHLWSMCMIGCTRNDGSTYRQRMQQIGEGAWDQCTSMRVGWKHSRSIEPRVLWLKGDMCCTRRAYAGHARITRKWCGAKTREYDGCLPLSERHALNTRRAHAVLGKAFSKSTPVSGQHMRNRWCGVRCRMGARAH